MAFSYTTTAIPDESSIVRGNVGIVGGDWDAGTFTSAQTIVTGGSYVLCAGFNNEEAVSESPKIVYNQNAAGATANGSIEISAATGDNSGTWWAIVKLSDTN